MLFSFLHETEIFIISALKEILVENHLFDTNYFSKTSGKLKWNKYTYIKNVDTLFSSHFPSNVIRKTDPDGQIICKICVC